jgi:hypothetical protein
MIPLLRQHLFVLAGLALNCGAVVNYALHRNWARALYWTAAATLTYLVTFVIR